MLFEKQILNMYRAMAYTRCDDNGLAYYFSKDDFPGLRSEAYGFYSSKGHKLQGYLYSYDDPKTSKLIVFDHGFGGGHRSYMKEIERLASAGFLVFAYDHTGCMESGGESPNGMAQSLYDLNDCIAHIKSDARFSGFDISVIGHSWGGFSTLNIPVLHPEISRIVVLSGFVSVEELIKTYFSGIMSLYRKSVMAVEREANPRFSDFDARQSLSESKAKALLIYSDNDKMCKRVHFDLLRKALSDKQNVTFKLVNNKGHNPNYTEDAVKYFGEYVSKKNKLMRGGQLNTDEAKAKFVSGYDWDKMTEQDESVWRDIIAFLES